jgi:hypothetical protein
MSPEQDVPATTPRRRLRRFWLAGLLVAVLVAGAGTAAGLLIFRKPAVTDPRALAEAELSASATPTATPYTGDLRSLLLAPPAFSRLWAKPFSADGTLTIAQVADWFGFTADELADFDITAAAIQQWHAANNVWVSIVLLNFPRPATAYRWASMRRDVDYTGNGLTEDSPLPGFPGSGLFYAKQPDRDGYFGVYAYVSKNDIAVNVAIYSPPPVDHQAVNALLEQQLARLP